MAYRANLRENEKVNATRNSANVNMMIKSIVNKNIIRNLKCMKTCRGESEGLRGDGTNGGGYTTEGTRG